MTPVDDRGSGGRPPDADARAPSPPPRSDAPTWGRELPSLVVLVVLYLATALAWTRAPARMPVHWNIAGNVDRYGGRIEGLLLSPLIATGAYLLMRFLPRIDPGRANYVRFSGAYDLIRTVILIFVAVVQLLTLLPLFGVHVQIVGAVSALAGLLFVVLGAAMGKVRPNWFVGIRTPWTLSSKTAWVRTHRLGGRLFVGTGALVFLSAFVAPRWSVFAILIGTAATVVTVMAYSYAVWRHADDRVPPAGTSPAE